MSDDPLRILVVEDSALYRQLIRNVLREIPDVEVVGAAKSGEEALPLAEQLNPDLLTLDVRMPGMDGIQVLKELKRCRSRTKAVMLSSLTATGAQTTTDALLEGAFDFILKPAGPDAEGNRRLLQASLVEKIAAFRQSHTFRVSRRRASPTAVARPLAKSAGEDVDELPASRCEAVLLGTSTGGPVALREVLPRLPGDFPVPILIVQHMPPQYTHSLAQRLNEMSQIEVVEACEGMVLEPGWAYLAPGGRHMKIVSRPGKFILRLTDDPPENSVRPSVDYLFRSAAEVFDGRVLGVVMTGMGRDGVEGCREIKKRRGVVLTEHPDTCVVNGMPKAIVDEGLSDRAVPLEGIAAAVVRFVRRGRDARG